MRVAMVDIIGPERGVRHIRDGTATIRWSGHAQKPWKPREGAGELFPDLPPMEKEKPAVEVPTVLCGAEVKGAVLEYEVTEGELRWAVRSGSPKMCKRCLAEREKRKAEAKNKGVLGDN